MNPWVKNPWAATHPGPYREGDRVRFHFGGVEVEGTVIEDRGNLGIGGKRLYGVRFWADDDSEGLYLELAAEDLKPGRESPAQNGG